VTSRLAAALLRLAQRTLEATPAGEHEEVLATIDAFVAAPSAATNVASTRVLHELRRRHVTRKLLANSDDRLFRRGIEAVRQVPGLPVEQADTLANLPMNARTGQRLLALAQLLEVHRELQGRAVAAGREIRRKLGLPPLPSATPPSTSGRPRRATGAGAQVGGSRAAASARRKAGGASEPG
jgi:hypothetical protein